MIVYAVFTDSFGQSELMGLFTTEEVAIEFAKLHHGVVHKSVVLENLVTEDEAFEAVYGYNPWGEE
jgi:hypothetical protein